MSVDLTKLRVVSKAMAQLLELPIYKTIEVAMTDKTLKDVDYKMVPATWLEAIAADLLRLAEDVDKAFVEGVIEGETKQAKLEVQARARFMKDLREGKIK